MTTSTPRQTEQMDEGIDARVRDYLPLVSQIAARFNRASSVSKEDLVQVGALGLLKAIRGYDRERCKNASFRSYATLFIRGEIQHYLRDQASLVQQPRRVVDSAARLAVAEEQLTRELERTPAAVELAMRAGLPLSAVVEAQQARDACTFYDSLDQCDTGEDQLGTWSERLPDRNQIEKIEEAETRAIVGNAVRSLGAKSRQVIEYVYFDEMTQKETARLLGWSEMKVSRAVRKALTKLKAILLTEIF